MPISQCLSRMIYSAITVFHQNGLGEKSVSFRIPLHRCIGELCCFQRIIAKKRIPSRQIRKEPNFQVGDYVLAGDPDPGRRAGRKLHLLWKGPFRITDTLNGYIFELENIINQARRVVHGDRIRYYTDKQLNVTAPVDELL